MIQGQDIDWHPLKHGGANFQTRKLERIDDTMWVYEHTFLMKLFPWFFIGIGSFVTLMFLITIIFWIIPAIFVVIGIIWRKRQKKAIITFDFKYGRLLKGKKLKDLRDANPNDVIVDFKDVAAIQILSEVVTSAKGGSRTKVYIGSSAQVYDSFEMNFVMKDKTRMNILDHGDLYTIKRDANELGEKLGVPVLLAPELVG
jgi:hypothetical protein